MCDSGTNAAAASRKAAEETSAGTSSSTADSLEPPRTAAAAGISAPKARNIRSVWSRLAAGSMTRVSPAARNPANNRHDFTWALATGER